LLNSLLLAAVKLIAGSSPQPAGLAREPNAPAVYDRRTSSPRVARHHYAPDGGLSRLIVTNLANGSANTTRRLTITHPSGRILSMSYGAANSANSANSADDRLTRLTGVALTGGTDPLGEFTWMGAGRWVSLAMRQAGINLSYKHAAGEPIENSGDPYDGIYCPPLRSRPANWLPVKDAASGNAVKQTG
jgi:hypothetical protein